MIEIYVEVFAYMKGVLGIDMIFLNLLERVAVLNLANSLMNLSYSNA